MVYQNRSSDNATATRLARLPIDKTAESWRVSWLWGFVILAAFVGMMAQ